MAQVRDATATEGAPPASLRDAMRAMPYSSIAAAVAVVWVALQLLLPADAASRDYLLLWGRMPLLVLACYAGWRAANANRARRRTKLAWSLIAAAIAVLIPADIYCGWLLLVLRADVEMSAADVLYLSYFPLMLAGLLVLPRGFANRIEIQKFALDAAIITLAGGLIVWEYSVRPAVAAAQADFSGQMLLDLSYPLGDLSTLLAIATVLLRVPTDRARAPLLFLAGALVTSLVGDTIWMLGGLPGWRDLRNSAYALWMFQPAFVIVAAELELRRPRHDEAARRWRPAFAWLPLLALALCYAMLGDVAARDPARLAELFGGAALLTGLVVLRQLVAQREHAALVEANVRNESEARFAALVERASDAILIVDGALDIAYASPAARQLTGGATRGSLAAHLVVEDAEALASFAIACTRAPIERLTLALRFRPEAPIETEVSVTNLLADPQVRGLVLNVRDVSERRALEMALREHRLHDLLTGIANRELLLERMAAAIVRADASGSTCALVVFDLDRFKLVNDGLGHRVGDQVLSQVASRLAAASTRSDTVARIGGDEFAVLLGDATHAENVRERVERLRAAIAEPLRIDQHAMRMTASAGLAFSASGIAAETLLRNADIALQHARTEGGDAVELFRGERHGRILERLALEAEVPGLLAKDAFGVAFEVCVDVASERPRALFVRPSWREANETPLEAVLAAVREAPAAVELSRRIRQLAERDLASLGRFVPDAEELSVLLPVDAAELRHETFAAQLREFSARSAVPMRKLVLVLDETALASLSGRALDGVTRARQDGARLALGGFGAAHAAFELVGAYRFDMLVLADTISASDAGERPATLLRAAISTGRSLGLELLAPGVRTTAQLALLRELGCDYASGIAIAPPLAYERLLPWLGARLAQREAV
ncbi:MAG TPA: diguanylate cyclase [Candidatus Saccharimonadia bacterium]|nr:diguanylate cyclase [Candidatus Saccharimonadia bacterium]